MAKRVKKTILTGITREQMEEAFNSYANADAKVRYLTAEMDAKLTKTREKYADELSKLEAEKEEAFDIMQSYATENRESLFSKRKSLETAYGTLGFRTGQPKLKAHKGMTWAGVLELLKVKGRQYVRVVEEIAKDKLLAERDMDECKEVMDTCRIDVVQDETFYVEPKSEE
jgi:phage host-nuclease inhibitor protein Gam